MDLTGLTGAWAFILLVSAPLSAVVSVFLLWLYRRAVLRGMSARTGASDVPRPPLGMDRVPVPGAPPLVINQIDHRTALAVTPEADATYQGTTRSLRRAAWVYIAAGLVYATIPASAWMVMLGDGFLPGRFLLLLSYYAWPIVLALGLIAAKSRREQFAIVGVYFAIIFAVALWGLILIPGLRVEQLVLLWLLENGPGTLLLLAFLARRVRAVGPLVLAFIVAGVAGALLVSTLVARSDSLVRALVRVAMLVGMGGTDVFILINLAGFFVLCAVGWWLLRWLGRRYQQKRLSDLSLTLDAMWLLFAVVQPLSFAFEGWVWILIGPLAFVAYKLVVQAGLTLCVKSHAGGAAGPTLLLLRVFSLGRRSERLFDALSKRWLRVGSIGLIAGPDLVTATVQPHEFLDFVGGRLSRQFIQGEADLRRRLSQFDFRPDPDGRHRVNEFFCRADTWQMTMRRLAARSDAVLMDLRSFSPTKQGCLYEMEQLLGLVSLENVVFVVDDTTDWPFLEDILQTLWQGLSADSPNRGLVSPRVRVFRVSTGAPAEVRALLKCLFGARPQAGRIASPRAATPTASPT
jgi:hypothetical protein